MPWTTKKDDLIKALNEMSDLIYNSHDPYHEWIDEAYEQIGKLRSLVDHLAEENTAKKEV
uniref:Uncharacterized protein n=1 Tax=viral metagenome TaxID=1070528 RepID=A0A6H1ZD50_9ZZZZ